MKLEIDIPDDVMAEYLARYLVSKREVVEAVEQAMRRLGPTFDAAVLKAAGRQVEERAERVVSEIVEARARRMMGKDQPLKPIVDAAVQAKIEQLKLGVS